MRALCAFVVAVAIVALLASSAAASAGHRVFYLTTHPRQCLIGGADPKWLTAVPCSNPKHNLEVYAVGHGGWGHAGPPTAQAALAVARTVCLTAYQRLTGHGLPSADGWNAFWPDPGSETAHYGDKIICSYRAWPKRKPLGAGWHVR